MMYEMATGKLPFTADSPVSVALKQINDTAKPVKEEMPSLPLGLSQIIARAMDKDPDMRYQSAQQMLRQVVRLGDNPETTFKPPKPTKKKGRVKTSRGMLPIILAITAAVFIVAVASAFVLVNKLFLSGDDTKTITVDEFAGKTFTDELQKYFDASDIYHLNLNQVYDSDAPAGYIMTQDPAAGENRKIEPGKKKCEITLTVSLGPKTMKMSDVKSLDYREATLLLKKMGLRVSTESITSDLYDVGHVISSAPEAGTVLERETALCCTSARAQAASGSPCRTSRARPRSKCLRRQPRRDFSSAMCHMRSRRITARDLSQIRAYRAEARQTKTR